MENLHQNNILSINSITEAATWFAAAHQETLVIFDVDCVLTMPANPILQIPTFHKYKITYENLREDLTKDERHILNHLLITNGNSQLVEADFPEIVMQLQQRNIKTIAMTAGTTGNIGRDLSFPDWRYGQLKKLGIDFSAMFLGKKYFTDLIDFAGDHPGIEKGIVYSEGSKNSKGDLLKHVFSVLKWQPKQIIAVDDRIKNLNSFDETISNMYPEIEFVGLHYHGADFVVTGDVAEEDFVNLVLGMIKRMKNEINNV